MLRIWFRRIFIAFVSVFLVRIFSLGFLLSPTLVLISPQWLLRLVVSGSWILELSLLVIYVLYAVLAIFTAKALSKNLILMSLYFISLPAILFWIAISGGGIVWGIVGNALLGSTLSVYWILSRELEEDGTKLSILQRNHK